MGHRRRIGDESGERRGENDRHDSRLDDCVPGGIDADEHGLELVLLDRLEYELCAGPGCVGRLPGQRVGRIVNAVLASASFEALGTTAQVVVSDPSALGQAVVILSRELDAVDRACSRFRDDSELVALNRSSGRPFMPGPLLAAALEVALGAARDSDGAVDPTVGAAMRRLGYDRDFSLVVRTPRLERGAAIPAPGWRTLELDDGKVTVSAGVEIDLGATAKAFAADRASAAIGEATGCGVLVNLGGDIAVAGAPPTGGWPVRVTDDHRATGASPGQTVAITCGGLATSSTTVRRWRMGGAELHHIVDPRSGQPSPEIWRTVSVAAATCVAANTASTAAIVRAEDGLAWLRASGLPARLVAPAGAVTRIGGWPEERP